MQHPNYIYWFWDSYLSPELCDILLRERAQHEERRAVIGTGTPQEQEDEHRNSYVVWLSHEHWLQGVMFNMARYANAYAAWSYKLEYPEPVQLARYSEGHYYKEHQDCAPTNHFEDIRKISVVVLLSDPADFEGGAFRIAGVDEPLQLKRGTLVAFPSAVLHQVEPVTKGDRYSAACWVLGKK